MNWNAKHNQQLRDEDRHRYEQAAVEGAALNGELDREAQIISMSAFYQDLRAAQHPHCPAIRAAMLQGETEEALKLIKQALSA